jgi:hypothetical protein
MDHGYAICYMLIFRISSEKQGYGLQLSSSPYPH